MIKDEFISGLRTEDLPESFQIVAELCGLEVALIMIEKLGGLCIYVPNPRSHTFEKQIGEFIINNRERYSINSLALGLNIDQRQIKKYYYEKD